MCQFGAAKATAILSLADEQIIFLIFGVGRGKNFNSVMDKREAVLKA